jgi:hypothetical protein
MDWMDRLGRGVKSFLGSLASLAGVLVIILIGELLPPLRAFDAFLKEHPGVEQALLVVTGGMTFVSILLLAGAQFLPEPRRPSSTSREEAEELSPPIEYEGERKKSRGRMSRRIDQAFSGEASFTSVKQAWRLKSWRYDRRWRILFAMMLGALLMLFGLFGIFIVVGPPGIKFLMILAIAYVLFMTLRGFSRA